jgi:hypothetical protein
MRHSGIMVQSDPNVDNFEVYHVIGTPGIGLTYNVVKDWTDPRDKTASLMAMNFVAWIPRQRARDLEAILGLVRPQISWRWNCQNWVQEGLQKWSKLVSSPSNRCTWRSRSNNERSTCRMQETHLTAKHLNNDLAKDCRRLWMSFHNDVEIGFWHHNGRECSWSGAIQSPRIDQWRWSPLMASIESY